MSGIASALANPSTCMLLIGKLCIAVYTDITFCIKQVNEAFTKHTGLDREQVLDKNLFDFFSLYNNENTIDEFLADLSSQNIAHAVLKLKFEDDVKWVDLYGTADRDYRNQINGFLIAGTVIDAHKKLEQLEQNELIKNYQRDLDIAQSYIQGLLPSPELFKRVNPNALLIYMPMRGIGGDWYWFKIEKNRTHFLMGDVMGHGVNAGIVSTLVASALSHFKDWHQIARPTDLVQLVHKSVYPIIKYNPSITEDFSMDIVTAIFYPETRELLYTSSNFSILAQRGDTFLDTNIQKQSLYLKQPWSKKQFVDSKLELQPADWVWVFSDGVKDQFDEVYQKRFSIKRLKELFIRVTHQYENAADVEKALLMTGREWMGQAEQTDDIILAGFKII